MKRLLLRLPAPVAAPFIALAVLIGGLLTALAVLMTVAAGAVAFFAFFATGFNLVGYFLLGDANALRAAAITGAAFVAAFSLPVMLGSRVSRAFRSTRHATRPGTRPAIRIELAR